jgi:hypothetical protein
LAVAVDFIGGWKHLSSLARWSRKHVWKDLLAEHTAAVSELEGKVIEVLATAKADRDNWPPRLP